jgi:hypothetical protein
MVTVKACIAFSDVCSSKARTCNFRCEKDQLHWPERHTNFFGTLAYGNQQAENDYDTTPLEETLLALQDFISAVKQAIWVLNTYKFTDT